MKHIIPYLFRASIAFYFIFPAVLNLRGTSDFVSSPLFKCFTASYAFGPDMVAMAINILAILLGVLILVWKRPLTPLILGILVLISEFILEKEYTFDFLMVIVPIALVSVGLAIFYSRHSDEW
jgi:type IV secretory pathway VirB3-like protein